MTPLFSTEDYAQYLRGYTIFDCAMNNEDRYCFLLVEEKNDREILPRTRFVIVLADMPPERRFGMYETGDLTFSTIARGIDPPEYVAVDTRANVYSSNAARKGAEKSMRKIIDMKTYRGKTGIVHKVVRAAGQVYALGNYRRIYRRLGIDQWSELGSEGNAVPLPTDVATARDGRDLGFEDMSAFGSDDIYAVGGKGDAWRFDGKSWHDCLIPTKRNLSTVCCAADGKVYVIEQNGSVWCGRADHWNKIVEADIAPGYGPEDAYWFKDRLYLGTQQGICVIDHANQSLVPLDEMECGAPGASNSGRLDISPDGRFLLTAGPHGACLNDGTGWRRLFSTFDFI